MPDPYAALGTPVSQADPYANLGTPVDAPAADAIPTDVAAPQGFSDEQKAQILAYLPKAKDAADLAQFAHDVSGGTHTIGDAQDVLDYIKGQGRYKGRGPGDPSKLQFTDPTSVQAPAQQPSTLENFRNAVGEGILNGIDAMFPGLGTFLRNNRDSGRAYTEHAANALAGDYGPEVGGFIHTVVSPSEWGDFGANLDSNIAHERAILQNDSEGHGLASAAGELTGAGLAAPIAGAALDALPAAAAASQAFPKISAVTKAALGGAVFGSGAAGPGERVPGAVEGAVIAPVAGALMKGALAIPGTVKSGAQTVLEGSPGLARRIIAKAIADDANTPESVGSDIAAAHANNVPMALADTGENTRGLLAAASRSSGMARTVARDALEERQAGLADRVTQAIQRDLGPVVNPHELADSLMTKARDEAAPLYEQAYAQPGASAFSDKVAPLLQRPSMKVALANAYKIAKEEGRDPTTLGFDFDSEGNVVLRKVPSWQTMDYIKRGLDDVVESYRDPTTGRLNLDTQGRAINNTRTAFLQAFDNANPTYAQARQAWGGPVSGISAMNTGRKFLNMTADDIEARMRDMTPFEKQMAALGARRAMAELVQSKGDTADVVNALVGTGKKRAMLARLSGDRPGFQRFVDTLGQEKEGWRTFKQALLGSPTAANLADDGALKAATTAADLATHGIPVATATSKAIKFLGVKLSQKAQQQIAAMLSNTDPAAISELAAQLRAQTVKRGVIVPNQRIISNIAGKGAAITVASPQQAQ